MDDRIEFGACKDSAWDYLMMIHDMGERKVLSFDQIDEFIDLCDVVEGLRARFYRLKEAKQNGS